ncbi:MAG TPA: hypothetical protein VLA21_03150, partial [Candidatus Limnocylindria bacterium]|nr:hypothetical protein [Candidatus Limnocylindria bacterium]
DLAADGVQVLATEVMSLDQVQDVARVYETATAGRRFPAPLVIAHINGIFDEYLAETAAAQGADVQPDALGQASLLLGRKICDYLRAAGNPHISYMAGGARGLHHFTDWVGAPGAVTINWGGTADKLLELDPPVTEVFRAPSSPMLVDELLAKMPDFHRAWTPGSLAREDYEAFGPVVKFRRQFEAGWQDALDAVRGRRR